MPGMPVLLVWLGKLIVTNVGFWLVSAALSLGIGLGVSHVAPGLIDASGIFSKFQASQIVWNWVGYLHLDTDITIVLSAWAGRSITDSVKLHLVAVPKAAP